jgi:imidazolonepropionase-like amidohydrolase
MVVRAARAVGLPVAAHCHGSEAIAAAVDARVDTIEHCTFFTDSGTSEPSEDLIRRVADSGIVVSATAGSLAGHPIPPLIAANLDTVRRALARIHELGGTVVAGTDAGVGPAKPHDVTPYAYAEFVAFGMTPTQALSAITSVAATTLSADGKGRIAAGADADLVAVAGDPLAQPVPLTDLVGVWHAGVRLT